MLVREVRKMDHVKKRMVSDKGLGCASSRKIRWMN